ncbi:sensor histidine kinase [Agriterribacter sp.]|uniref:sensor histidine kinase n=1 Tax=Agriterribacter sp. TaxID=2821509 RepID=UPI002C577CDE|nr:histidine kinase [Agriterribacter sp.]HTN08129.1 histidine kinase [Agriterribacter sp.]
MAVSALSISKYRYYFIIFWISWSAIHAWVLQEWGYSFEASWLDSAVCNILLAGMSLLIITSLRYYLPRKESFTYLFLMCIGFALLWLGCAKMILPYVADEFSVSTFNESLPIRLAIAILVSGCVILISVLGYTLEEQKEQESRKNESEKIVRDAELYKLRQQLQPHFLFNSLNSISALVISQPAEARRMIQQLSDYLRSTLKKEEHMWVMLSEELQYLELYLDIEKVRFGRRLTTDIRIEAPALSMTLPAMLLQPVVENAIKFGLYDTTGDITISIDTAVDGQMLIVTVKNPFDPEISQPKRGTGFGLSSVQRRLSLLFARNDLLSIFAVGNIFITQVKIPQQ